MTIRTLVEDLRQVLEEQKKLRFFTITARVRPHGGDLYYEDPSEESWSSVDNLKSFSSEMEKLFTRSQSVEVFRDDDWDTLPFPKLSSFLFSSLRKGTDVFVRDDEIHTVFSSSPSKARKSFDSWMEELEARPESEWDEGSEEDE
jgi:hypothetical protein